MFNHVMLGSNDIARSKIFYDALFAAMGGRSGRLDDRGRLYYTFKGGTLLISKPIDGGPATVANGSTLGFAMDDPEQANAWHKAGVQHGGTAIEDPPGLRVRSLGKIYLAYLRDPDGNKLCAARLLNDDESVSTNGPA